MKINSIRVSVSRDIPDGKTSHVIGFAITAEDEHGKAAALEQSWMADGEMQEDQVAPNYIEDFGQRF